MANQLAMDKALAIKHLQQAGYSERKIAEQLGVSRKAVRYHLGRIRSKGTKAPTGSALKAPTGSALKAPTGSALRRPPGPSPPRPPPKAHPPLVVPNDYLLPLFHRRPIWCRIEGRVVRNLFRTP